MENPEILEKKYLQEKEKFKIDIQAWNNNQQILSNDFNRKMQEMLSLKKDFYIKQDIKSKKYDINSNSFEEDIQKRDALIINLDKLKYIYESKLQQMKNMKNNLQKEKLIFESQANELKNKIKKERSDIDKIQIEIDKENDEIKYKNTELTKKEKIIKEKDEELINLQNLIEEKNNKNIKNEKDLQKAEYKKNFYYKEILDKDEEIKKMEDKVNKEIKLLEDDKEEIFKIKNDIEEINQEINLRMNCLNDMNNKNFINTFDNISNQIYMQQKKDEINSEFFGTYNKKEDNINGMNKFDKYKTNSFNSELFLLKLKNRIDINRIKINGKYDTINRKFDHEKEQEFLMKSFESLNKIKK